MPDDYKTLAENFSVFILYFELNAYHYVHPLAVSHNNDFYLCKINVLSLEYRGFED